MRVERETAPASLGITVHKPSESTPYVVAPLDSDQPAVIPRPRVAGKFLFVGDAKFYVKGVTYGAFKPDETGNEYSDQEKIDRDFQQMAASGINTVRIPHTVPPRSLLDTAEYWGLRVMVALSAEQYVGYLIDREKRAPNIEGVVRKKVRSICGHPALLCYALGNEIPASVVRWLGPRRVEQYLHKIFCAVKAEDPDGIVTYVNYPTTEYLELPFLDVICFNVYLESQGTLNSYLLRLQNIASDRPLIMSELGLDALRNSEEKQASVLDWQIRTTFAAGCAGAIVFSWTDEWFRAGEFVKDWSFGLTNSRRQPKPALTAVGNAFREAPFAPRSSAPRFSVIVCTHNGADTIRDCLAALEKLRYPNYEVIVVNDGSTDETESLVRDYDVGLITIENKGLSHARNVGLEAATGEFVAYIDDDAYPDEHWLCYLANSFTRNNHVGVGGPNIDPPNDGLIAACVANAPGGPVHVLLTDEIAEHLPGCNMAFRKSALKAVGGFDSRFRVAGDDVDICWRLQQRGWTLGFSPSGMVWHHPRKSVRAYWKQQRGYGRAEALLEAKWPEKYNSAGHHTLLGRIYGKGFGHIITGSSRIYHGVWGSAPFQSLYQQSPGTLLSLPTMPEWYLIIGVLAAGSALGFSWSPLFSALPLLILTIGLTLLQVFRGAVRASFSVPDRSGFLRFKLRILTALLHLIQPLARLIGRIEHGLTFWRRRGLPGFAFPLPRQFAVWSEDWLGAEKRLEQIEASLSADRVIVLCGDQYAQWDLEVRDGMFGAARLLMAVEDHGAGAKYVRWRIWPRWRRAGRVSVIISALITAAAAFDQAWIAAALSALVSTLFLVGTVRQSGSALAALLRATREAQSREHHTVMVAP